MKRSLYKKIDHETSAWDLDARSSRYVNNSTDARRKLKKKLHRMARKRINKELT
jgi:hypothetical protein